MDRRTMTRALLKEGLLTCLQSTPFKDITVTQLAKISGITRSTFYLHYTNIIEIVDDLVEDAIKSMDNGKVDALNLEMITNTLGNAKNIAELRKAYETIYPELPLCQRVTGDDKYRYLFTDEQLSEYILQYIIQLEKDVQAPAISRYLGVPKDTGEAIFIFLVHGLYAVNRQFHWERTDKWLIAQQAIFAMVHRGLMGA